MSGVYGKWQPEDKSNVTLKLCGEYMVILTPVPKKRNKGLFHIMILMEVAS